ncbi:MAG: hypothetical protein QNJ53_02900 [Pleurocapsa sp. MO_192.B19]|nr:hypothetical protein [Pleurocapsa sp. MO_192.B19]
MSKKKLPTGPIRIDLPMANSDQKIESAKQENSKVENSKVDSITPGNQILDSTNLEQKQDSSKQDSGLLEYKKVAMRLSVEAASTLRQLRAETGIPYEILVDVAIRNWDNLPQRTKSTYLKQAREVRAMRLMAGQEKTIKTMKQKYLER